MKAANDVFENWYSSNFTHEKGDEDIKALFREAFEAGMVSGIYFIETNTSTSVSYTHLTLPTIYSV